MTFGILRDGFRVAIFCGAVQACGGTVDNGSSPAPAASSGDSVGSTTNDGSLGSSQLANCKVGFPVAQASDANPCHFVGTDNRCYSTLSAACNCICPRDLPSVVCSASGWGLGNDQDLVICD
jgi:hypothetical protein